MAASRTAEYVAAYRALESLERRPHVRDPFAGAFLSRELRWLVRASRFAPLRASVVRYADRRAPGARTSAIARTCYIDDIVRNAVSSGARQFVILGAGFDCRAHRLPELRATLVFEVDRAETQAMKRPRLASTPERRSDVRYVVVDFLRDDLAERLVAAGCDPGVRTVFVWEGVTNYLTEPAVTAVLSFIGRYAPGSTVVFTYVHRRVLDDPASFVGGVNILDNVRRLGEPWTFGLRPEDVGAFLARSGLELVEDLGADDYRRRYLMDTPGTPQGYTFYRAAVGTVPIPGPARPSNGLGTP